MTRGGWAQWRGARRARIAKVRPRRLVPDSAWEFDKDPLAYYELACGGMASWARWDQRLGGVGYRRTGEVRWTSDPHQGRDLAERVTRARRWGYPVVPVDEAGLQRLLPAAVPGPVSFAAHAVSDAQVEPDQTLAACRAALGAAGARLLLGEDAHVRLDAAGVRIQVGGEVLRPSTAVLAAGAMSVEVAGAVGLDVPMTASPGMLVVTTPVPPLTDKVWPTRRVARDRRCTCGSGRMAPSSLASGPKRRSLTTRRWSTRGRCSLRPPASSPARPRPGLADGRRLAGCAR